ncbi:MAG: hypothetical protein AABZ45_04865 [Pseudomonadota bacterium]
MKFPTLALANVPSLAQIPAAHGALFSPIQVTGSTVFDVVITVIMINLGDE